MTGTKGAAPAGPGRDPMARYRIGGLLLILAVTYLVGEAIAVAGWQGRPYEWTRDAISALGVPERQHWGPEIGYSSLHLLMNVTFIGSGVRALLAGLVLAPFAPRRGRIVVLLLAVAYAAGLVIVGLFPAGMTAVRANMHGLGAFLGIIGGTVLLLALTVYLARAHRRLAVFTGVCALVAVVGCVGMGLWVEAFGLFERMAVDAVIVWQIGAGGAVLASRPPAR